MDLHDLGSAVHRHTTEPLGTRGRITPSQLTHKQMEEPAEPYPQLRWSPLGTDDRPILRAEHGVIYRGECCTFIQDFGLICLQNSWRINKAG